MFEAYTETARRTMFMARHEASKAGSDCVQVEHIFLGLLHADEPLALRAFQTRQKMSEVRDRIAREMPRAEATDLPISRECQRVLSYAAAEAENLQHRHIAPGHLMLGILRENTSLTARVVIESGITISQLEEDAKRMYAAAPPSASAKLESVRAEVAELLRDASSAPALTPASRIEGFRDLVAEARDGKFQPLIGHDRELDQAIRILSRRTKNSPALIGEPGIGKGSIVQGLAQLIADENAPACLAGRKILEVDATDLAAARSKAYLQEKLLEIGLSGGPILYVRGLFDLRENMIGFATLLKRKLQIIATGTPLSPRLALDRHEELARHFEFVSVLPPTEEESIQILHGSREGLEKFHGVAISAEAIQTAVTSSGRFLRNRELPDRALDLLDEAATGVKLRRDVMPPELVHIKARLNRIVRQMDREFADHRFEQAHKLSDEQKAEHAKLERVEQELKLNQPSNTVTAEDIIEVIASRTSLTVLAVKQALERPLEPDLLAEISKRLTAKIPPGRRDWVEGLLAYLSDCSAEHAEQLWQAIRTAKARLKD
jgi:ATP-dependent Clp protease ATP-binding subunit ClpC